MNPTVQIVAISLSLLLLVLTIELVRRKLLVEEMSFAWILGAIVLLGFSCFRGALHTAARWLGIDYPPSLLLLGLVLFVFLTLLYFSVVISTHRRQLRVLFEESAVLAARVRELEAEKQARPDPVRSVGAGDR